jgi:EAL domain-containing protein (putative c-di-GMP-specific phosphodiesterase class I)/DNA-binding response OmpR family regulator/GGDEF domain-containing protein
MQDARVTTILIADDDPAQRLLVETALAAAGFLVHVACDGQEAVEQFPGANPDCVILDVMMPRMTGIEACREIRRLAGGRLLPVLMLTGRNDLLAISDAYSAGATDFAQKGLNPRLLVERVRFLLRDRAQQEELLASRSKLLLAQRIARVGHWELRPDGSTLSVSPVIAEMLEVEAEKLAGYESFVRMLAPADRESVRQAFLNCATGGGRFSFDHTLRTPRGTEICVHQEAETVEFGSAAQAQTIIVTCHDLTRLRRAEENVRLLSNFDTASGLPNRRYLADQVMLAIEQQSDAVASAVVAYRLHDFDRIVHAQGVETGTRLLVQVARRLEEELARIARAGGEVLWRSDLPGVCRTSDGELALLIRSRVSAHHLAQVARAALQFASAPEAFGSTHVPAIGAGIAPLVGSAAEAEQIIVNAHAAAEQAREPGSCRLYSSVPQAQSRRRLQIESALRAAVQRQQLHAVYEPRVAIDTLDLVGVECLVRWEHPQFGALRPDEFAEIAEASGSSEEIGRWALDEAAGQVAAWRRRFAKDMFLSLSLSARQLQDGGLVAAVDAALDRHKLPAAALELELAEASIARPADETRTVLAALRTRGVRIAIDEFGTGYSSLSQVRRLAFDCLKVGRSLIAELYTDLGAQGVAAAVLAMARALRVRSVAEGVEDSAAVDMLRALGCDEIQGPYISPPLGARAFEGWLEEGATAHLRLRDALELEGLLESSAIALAGRIDKPAGG